MKRDISRRLKRGRKKKKKGERQTAAKAVEEGRRNSTVRLKSKQNIRKSKVDSGRNS